MADINVTVTVDTETITPENLSSTVVLTDDNGDSDDTPGDSETFDIHAGLNKTVQFTIVAKDSANNSKVSFVSFNDENGVAGFVELPSADNEWTGTTSPTSVEDTEEFNIVFNVEGNADSPFTLDPKLKADQGG